MKVSREDNTSDFFLIFQKPKKEFLQQDVDLKNCKYKHNKVNRESLRYSATISYGMLPLERSKLKPMTYTRHSISTSGKRT